MKNIIELSKELGIPEKYILPYGWNKAKIDLHYSNELREKQNGKLILVTAITPTKAGEGKTTTTIGLHDGFHKIGVNSLACLREPSLGPVWGIKGGAVGALKSTIVPSDDINLHFTGDFHALTSTINLISAIIENHIYQGNELNINPNKIVWTRALDINDRSLRSITVNANGTAGFDLINNQSLDDKIKLKNKSKEEIKKAQIRNTNHLSEFTITVASELMTIFCEAIDEADFEKRVNNIIVAYTYEDEPVTFGQFNMSRAIMKMMKDALNPNLVQTLEGNPVIVHGGPFANVSIGVNSLISTKLALKLAPVVITEAGFGSDLGAEKFLDIKCQLGNIKPSCVVVVATVKALKLHGGVEFENLEKENVEAMLRGTANLKRHCENMMKYNLPIVIAINKFPNDTDNEINELRNWCEQNQYDVAVNSAALEGGEGAIELARKVRSIIQVDELSLQFKPLYNVFDRELSIKDKIFKICHEIYRASDVSYTKEAEAQIEQYEKMGYNQCFVCISKTPSSLTDNPTILNAPENFTIHIREVRLYAGANLIVPLSGDLLLMPGLPKEPRCLNKFN